MNITSYSKEKIQKGLTDARADHPGANDYIRLLFAPTDINEDNFERACDIYSRIDPDNYETVVIIESYDEVLDKKLPMPSNKYFETPLGRVEVNDYMRNEFCDEDDDFFIHDEGFNKDMSLFSQLMMLQCIFDDFSVVSVQIADMAQAIVKELAHVMQEVLAPRRALIIFCCRLDNRYKEEFEKINKLLEDENESGLLNYLNSGESNMEGVATFIAGVLVAKAWELDIRFLEDQYSNYRGSLLTGYADRQKVLL
ncbi:AmmeMemoRadiSam system protein B [Balneolaceae bacterium YR4-1]|uniref:AmmeMemoRadiSam system protein B n=1 Tax=Halalkalibaculum roseum TaxID=2709311 RepID=A0A6M1SXQ0_9BACT|nr:AmmeMemoRadiSam system protein B [Halalkalibaculum roseum]NGP76746.1 AmmeMemoRadiSam system protein B [Halalkalibaculum roseum]